VSQARWHRGEHHAADLAIYTLAFEATKNPIFAWIAARHCAFSGHMLPESVAAYLIRVADALFAEVGHPERKEGPRLDVRDAVRNAVFGRPNRLGGPGTPYSNFRRDWLHMKTTCEISERTSGFVITGITCTGGDDKIESDQEIVDSIYKLADKHIIGHETALKGHYKWEHRLAPVRKPRHRRSKPAS
jgi:hypothetical protein